MENQKIASSHDAARACLSWLSFGTGWDHAVVMVGANSAKHEEFHFRHRGIDSCSFSVTLAKNSENEELKENDEPKEQEEPKKQK